MQEAAGFLLLLERRNDRNAAAIKIERFYG